MLTAYECCSFGRFWAGPIVAIIAMKYMEAWVREKVVNGVQLTVTFVAYVFFLVSPTCMKTAPVTTNQNISYCSQVDCT